MHIQMNSKEHRS